MTRDAAFWTMIVCIGVIPSLALGFLRGRAITRTYRGIYEDLKKAGIEISRADFQLLIAQLHRNPKAILNADSHDELQRIKELHLQSLLNYLKPIRYCFWIVVGVGIVALFTFQHLWPNK